MKTRWIEIVIIVLALGLLSFCFAGWDNTKPSDSDGIYTWPTSIRANWDALEAVLSVDLAGAHQFYNVQGVGYAATGNGSTDDTAAIQLAIDAAEAAGGGIVIFPEPTTSYRIENTLIIDSMNVTLLGDGSGLVNIDVIDGVTIGVDVDASYTNIINLDFEGSDQSTPTDIGVDISSSAATCKIYNCRFRYFSKGINLATCNRVNVDQCNFSGCIQYIVTDNSGGTSAIHQIINNIFGTSDLSTEDLVSIDSTSTYVLDNYFETVTTTNKKRSINVSADSQTVIIANNILETSGSVNVAINMDGVIEGNIFKECAAYANPTDDAVIRVTGVSCRVANNVLHENGVIANIYGISVAGVTGVIGNRLNKFEQGIRFSGTPVIIGNALANCTTGIVGIATNTRAEIANNVFDGNTTDYSITGATACRINGFIERGATSNTATSGIGEDDLKTTTIPQDYDHQFKGLRIKAAGTKTAANDNKTIKLYWGASSVTFNAAANDTNDWRLEAELIFVSGTDANLSWIGYNGTTVLQGYEDALADDLSAGDITLKITGECANASDTITQTMWEVSSF